MRPHAVSAAQAQEAAQRFLFQSSRGRNLRLFGDPLATFHSGHLEVFRLNLLANAILATLRHTVERCRQLN